MISHSEKHDHMANALRFLALDAIEEANSGHPGLPMGAADIVTVLFSRFLKFDPKAPDWPDRDRFILSAGHGSMLLYALLYLTGYDDMPLEEIRRFRQLGSKTPGHPEYGLVSGIETTTGPLAQGLGNAVGFALGERILNASFGDLLVDHRTWVLVGDGCLMEGLSQEAIALAGHLGLHKLVVIWDNNGISIDGPLSLSDSTDQLKRFAACNWNTLACDGHDREALAHAFEKACAADRPTLIAAKTCIGFGSPSKSGTSRVHGSPLGKEELIRTRKALNWDFPPFHVPSGILDAWRLVGLSAAKAHHLWKKHLDEAPLTLRSEFERRLSGKLLPECDTALLDCKRGLALEKPLVATRQASLMVLEVINDILPETIGGSADLTPSNNTCTSRMKALSCHEYKNRYIHYGIREHGMVALMNGLALHGGIIPYGGSFLCFSDYARPSIRLACLMGIRSIFIMTHDSIGLGEDGPTHQPVEHLASLRAIPNHYVLRPADAVEVAECWQIALQSCNAPSTLVLTRQALPAFRTVHTDENACLKGAYEIVSATQDNPVTIFASGSEVAIALTACNLLCAMGYPVRVISVPCLELFDRQDAAYRKHILGQSSLRIAVEAGVRQGWDRFIGVDGVFIGMSGFGASGAIEDLYRHFGITAENIVAIVRARLDP